MPVRTFEIRAKSKPKLLSFYFEFPPSARPRRIDATEDFARRAGDEVEREDRNAQQGFGAVQG